MLFKNEKCVLNCTILSFLVLTVAAVAVSPFEFETPDLQYAVFTDPEA